MLTPGQRIEQDTWVRAERERILAPTPTPTQIFAQAVGELAMALVYSTDAGERRRVAGLLGAVCSEASRIAAKRGEEAA
jgi:hypothetical protein